MQANLQNSSNARRTISLLAIVTVTAGIALAAYDADRRSSPSEASAGQKVKSDPSLVRSNAKTPRFERSNEPAIEVDAVNAHGG